MAPFLSIFGLTVKAYSLCAFLAALIGMAIAYRNLIRQGMPCLGTVLLLASVCVGFLVGARLWNIAVNPDAFGPDKPWYTLRMTGFSLYGGLAGAIIAVFIYVKVSRNKPGLVLDAFVVPFGIAFCVSRVGCFLNGCCGGIRTDLPWGVVFPTGVDGIHTVLFTLKSPRVHPTQIYELLAALAGLPVCLHLAKHVKAGDGGLFGLYGAWFCLMRLAILPLRALPYAAVVTNIIYPAVYAGLTIAGLVLFARRKGKQKR